MGIQQSNLRAVGLAPALFAAACATRDPAVTTANTASAGNWRIERQVDRITGAPLASALLVTRNASNSTVAFPQPAMLQLTCFDKRPLVRLSFNFKVGSNRNSRLGYRFDDKPGHEIDARFLDDYKTVVIEDRAEVERFASELASSGTLYVLIRSLNAGRSSAEFKLDGAPAAIEAGFAGCRPAAHTG